MPISRPIHLVDVRNRSSLAAGGSRPRIARILSLLTVFAAIAFIPRGAQAQGGAGPFEPITTPDLQKIVKMLDLSDQQQLSLLPIHDAYKERFRRFQETEVQELIDQAYAIAQRFMAQARQGPGGFQIPPRAELEAVLDQFQKIMQKAQSIDRSFFAEIGAVLSEEQALKLERARITREIEVFRDLLAEMVGEVNGGARVNLTEMTRGLKLSPDEQAQVDVLITSYESSLLAQSRRIFTVLTEAAKVVLDTIDQLGLRTMTMEQMMALGQDQRMIQRLQTTFDEASKPLQDAAHDLSQLNLRTFRQIQAVISPEHAAELRDRYYQRAYSEVWGGEPLWRRHYHEALTLEGLAEQEKKAIDDQRALYASQEDAAVDQGAALLDDHRKYRTFAQLSEQGADPVREKIDELVERKDGIGATAEATLQGLLGEERYALVNEKEDDERRGRAEAEAQRGRVEVSVTVDGEGNASGGAQAEARTAEMEARRAEVQARRREARSVDNTLPQPMTVAELNLLVDRLGWGESEKSVAMSLYDEYRKKFDALRMNDPEGDEDGEGQPEASPTDQMKARQAKMEAATQLDSGFFEDLALLAGGAIQEQALRQARGTRERVATTQAAQGLASSFGEDEAYIDLGIIVTKAEIAPASRQAIANAIDDYAVEAGRLARERLAASADVNRVATTVRRLGEQSRGGELAQQKWQETRQALHGVNERLVELNRQWLLRLQENLPESDAWLVRLEYNRTAFEDIYNDRRSAEKAIEAALMAPELAEHQRERINALAQEYRAVYVEHCEKMVELRRERRFDFETGGIPAREDINREMLLERLRFEQEELADRARMQLAIVLTDEQALAIAELQR